MSEERKFVGQFLELPHHIQHRIACDLFLTSSLERDLPDVAQFVIWFKRAQANGKMLQFQEAVASEYAQWEARRG